MYEIETPKFTSPSSSLPFNPFLPRGAKILTRRRPEHSSALMAQLHNHILYCKEKFCQQDSVIIPDTLTGNLMIWWLVDEVVPAIGLK